MRIEVKNSMSALKENWEPVKTYLRELQKGLKEEKEAERLEECIQKIEAELVKFKTD